MFLSQSSKLLVDPLSQALMTLDARSLRRTRFEASGDWSLAFPAQPRLKFVAVVKGCAWALPAGGPAEWLREGDVFLIGDIAYGVASDPGLRPIDGAPLYAGRDQARIGNGEDTAMLGGGIAFAHEEANFFLDALPPFLRIDGVEAESARRILLMLDAEIGAGRPGGALVTARLAEWLVVEAIRAYLAKGGQAGWIGALKDPHLSLALKRMHGEVARPWTVAALATEAGMSRSAFAARFRDQVGKSPLAYLTDWRMALARRRLRDGQDVAAVAESVGYSSPSAFGHAFKRAFGRPPRQAAKA